MKKDSLGDRMKRYENVNRDYLIPRTPTIIRVDGKAFHTFTKEFEFPFCDQLHAMMGDTAKFLCDEIQNSRLAYYQSDEISILLNDWDELNTEQWFGGNIQKIVSVSASAATHAFGNAYATYCKVNKIQHKRTPLFDARVFQVPREEVTNYFIWRQQDATRNSVQMLGRQYFSHNEMHLKNVPMIHDMLMLKHGVNWNDLETWKRRGAAVHRGMHDGDIPIFTADREYIENLL